MATSATTCLTCFADLSPSALPKCVIHSCCSRPVCSTCLIAMPRLATFCPFCEGVNHALRKGPRNDVIRAGQVVFDAESVLMEQDEGMMPPPAYEENANSNVDGKFILEEDDDEDDNNQPDRTPQLLQSSRLGLKQSAAMSQVDPSKAATISNATSASILPSTDSLKRSLSKHGGETSQTMVEPSREILQKSPSNETTANAGSSKLRKDKSPDSSGLTRQYWLRPNDTLMSLCLRFKVNPATLCKLNDLPLSTANTTPHLVHTRQFLLIPEGAIQSALTSSSGNAEVLQSALDGPVAQSRKQKVHKARREAQSKFRAIIAKNDSLGKGKARVDNGDVTLCDDRAAKAYISLMEAELKCIDFGDGPQEEIYIDEDDDDTEEQDAAIDANRRERFNVIVKQAVCRWEMDSDWERQQRALGIIPIEAISSTTMPTRNHSSGTESQSWLKRFTLPSSNNSNRVGWMEKAR